MKVQEILDKKEHREWPTPDRSWQFYQEWNDVLFLHWHVDAAVLKTGLPEGVEIDLFEGQAWVSLVAFDMVKVRPKGLPHFPSLSNFHEINIRTYIKHKGRAGVYFLSIEAGNRISAQLSRQLSGLPYRYSSMQRGNGVYTSANKGSGDQFQADFKIGEPLTSKTAQDLWLTERYCLVHDVRGQLRYFDVHHAPWPVQSIVFDRLRVNYPSFADLFGGVPDKVHYSQGVSVLAWSNEQT